MSEADTAHPGPLHDFVAQVRTPVKEDRPTGHRPPGELHGKTDDPVGCHVLVGGGGEPEPRRDPDLDPKLDAVGSTAEPPDRVALSQ